MKFIRSFSLCLIAAIVDPTKAFGPHLQSSKSSSSLREQFPFTSTTATTTAGTAKTRLRLLEKQKQGAEQQKDNKQLSVEEITEKYGLEVGLTRALFQKKATGENTVSSSSDSGTDSAKSLLKKYGIAYLATSIPLAIISFSLCYVLVDQGVDVSKLLAQIGIQQADMERADQAGTLALAYAAHKAASPIRFPPTVLLTPIVAKWLGKEPNTDDAE